MALTSVYLVIFIAAVTIFGVAQWLRIKAARRQEAREKRMERQQEELDRLLKK